MRLGPTLGCFDNPLVVANLNFTRLDYYTWPTHCAVYWPTCSLSHGVSLACELCMWALHMSLVPVSLRPQCEPCSSVHSLQSVSLVSVCTPCSLWALQPVGLRPQCEPCSLWALQPVGLAYEPCTHEPQATVWALQAMSLPPLLPMSLNQILRGV